MYKRNYLKLLGALLAGSSMSISQALLSDVQKAFVSKHAVSLEISQRLDKYGQQLNEMLHRCRASEKCATMYSVKKWDWLPGYYIKYGVFRLEGAEFIRAFITRHELNLLTTPHKYYYHIKGRPDDLDDQNYLIIAQEEELDWTTPLTKPQMEQLMFFATHFEFRDNHAWNVIPTKNGKISIVDTGAEAFWFSRPTKHKAAGRKFMNISKYVSRHGVYLTAHRLEKGAYELVIAQLAKNMRGIRDKYYRMYLRKDIIDYIDELPRPWPYDYHEALKKHHLL